MKINELVEELIAVRGRCGNIEVRIDSEYDAYTLVRTRPVESVDVYGTDYTKAIRKDGRYPDDVVVVI